MKKINGYQIIQLFEQWAPKSYAMEGDRIGLQIGTLNKQINHVLIALDVTIDVVEEAIEKKVDLIIAHHPIIFQPLKRLTTDEPSGILIEKLIKHDIAVYAAHTNLDVATGGVNDMLASKLGLKETDVLIPTFEHKLRKLVVYVPKENTDQLLAVLGDVGTGAIGNYSHCSFATEGTGRFLPGDQTTPHIGKIGQLTSVEEARIETVYPIHLEKKVISALLKAHPYEEPAYDIYDLQIKGEELGLGRIGVLDQEMTLEEFSLFIKEALDAKGVRIVGNLQDKVKKVAILGGDGNKYFSQAKFKGADVYITGDIYYHTAHDAMNIGLNIIDPGHNIEKIMKSGTADYLRDRCLDKGFELAISASTVDTDPFTFM